MKFHNGLYVYLHTDLSMLVCDNGVIYGTFVKSRQLMEKHNIYLLDQ